MDKAIKDRLLRRWDENVRELRMLAGLPVGASDPAKREDELRIEMEEILSELGPEFGIVVVSGPGGEVMLDLTPEARREAHEIINEFSKEVGRPVSPEELGAAYRALREEHPTLSDEDEEGLAFIISRLKGGLSS